MIYEMLNELEDEYENEGVKPLSYVILGYEG